MTDIFVLEPRGLVILAAAAMLDLILGDPDGWPHPVRLMGRAIALGEKGFRRLPVPERTQGALLVLLLVSVTWIAVKCGLELLGGFSPLAEAVLSLVLIYYGLSLRCLGHEAVEVARALEAGGSEGGRKRIRQLVSRDTGMMDEDEVAAAAVETVAENFVDGVISPFCYAAAGGPALCMLYKMINTMDSMLGYRNQRYRRFGTWAARLDDIANYLPARLSVAAIMLASPLVGGASPGHVRRIVAADGGKHDSPNSGLPEAAFAAALGVRLSGPAWYHGRLRERPFMNETGRTPRPEDIGCAVRLLYVGSLIVAVVILLVAAVFVGSWIR